MQALDSHTERTQPIHVCLCCPSNQHDRSLFTQSALGWRAISVRPYLDHYLEVLRGKPGALPGSTALAQARAAGTFTAEHEAFWAAARKTDGDTTDTRELIDVLLLHRSMAAADMIAGIAAALTVGAVTRMLSRSKPDGTHLCVIPAGSPSSFVAG